MSSLESIYESTIGEAITDAQRSSGGMAALDMPPRHFRQVLPGLCRRNFYGQQDTIDHEDLREALYPENCGLDAEGALAHIAGLERVLCRAAKEHWDTAALTAQLAESEMKPGHREVFAKFWAGERASVHEVMQKKSTWTAHLEQLSWRIDVKTASSEAVSGSLFVRFEMAFKQSTAHFFCLCRHQRTGPNPQQGSTTP